jgi:hypothetical protein
MGMFSSLDPTSSSFGDFSGVDPTTEGGLLRIGTLGISDNLGLGDFSDLDPTNPYGTVGSFINPGAEAAKDNQQAIMDNIGLLNFQPVNVTTGMGSFNVDPETGAVSTQLSEPYAHLRNQLLTDINPGQEAGVFSNAQGTQNALSALNSINTQGNIGPTNQQNILTNTLGSFTPQNRQPASITSNQVGASNASAFHSNIAAPDMNTSNLLKQQYDALKASVAGDQQKAQTSLENRLFAQGMLGSTGGAERMNALLDAQADQDSQLLNQAFGQAQAQAGLNLAGFNAQAGDEFRRQASGVSDVLNRDLANLNSSNTFNNQLLNRDALGLSANNQFFNQTMGLNNTLFGRAELARQLTSPERQLALGNTVLGSNITAQDAQNRGQGVNNQLATTNANINQQNMGMLSGIENASMIPLNQGISLGQMNYANNKDIFQAITGAEMAVNNAEMGNALFLRDLITQGGMTLGASAMAPQAMAPGMFGPQQTTVAGPSSPAVNTMFPMSGY